MSLKQLHLNLFSYGVGHHQAAWRHRSSAAERLGTLDYHIELAQLAERGLFDAVFFADGQSLDPRRAAESPSWFFEPLTLLTVLSQHTRRIGLISTVSSSFYTPFHAARLLASLQQLSGGRVGVNVVTSMFDSEAQNHSMSALPEHAQRYARADEFIRVLSDLWASWPMESLQVDREGHFMDPSGARAIAHRGEYFAVNGPLNVPVSHEHGPPVIFQAGASEPGREMAARYAEGIYAVAADHQMGVEYARDLRQRSSRYDRDPHGPLIMPGLVCYVGRSMGEAHTKKRALDQLLPVEQGLRQLVLFTQQDVSDWELDEPVPPLPPLADFTGPRGRYATILRLIEVHRPTVRELLGFLAAGGGHCTMIGTPQSIADEIELWLDTGAADGFNLMPPSLPEGLRDFVDLVVPELQRRGRFRTGYQGIMLRSHLAQGHER
ncbi:LLM class flavin-dependent oxidoreductase [Glutamicibacter endophyticus]